MLNYTKEEAKREIHWARH